MNPAIHSTNLNFSVIRLSVSLKYTVGKKKKESILPSKVKLQLAGKGQVRKLYQKPNKVRIKRWPEAETLSEKV